MAKKRSSNTATQTPENPVVEQGKPSSTPKKPGGEIDEIFSGKKSKKSLQEKSEDPKKFGKEIDDIFSGKKRKKPEPEKKAEDNVATKSSKVQKKNSQARNKGPKDINRSVDKLPIIIYIQIKKKAPEGRNPRKGRVSESSKAAMGGGNGQKAKMAREKNLEKNRPSKGSQLETNKKAMSIQCKVCMQTFICTTSEVKCREHAEAKHPKSDVEACFPHLKK